MGKTGRNDIFRIGKELLEEAKPLRIIILFATTKHVSLFSFCTVIFCQMLGTTGSLRKHLIPPQL
jgi:hypothetical protein